METRQNASADASQGRQVSLKKEDQIKEEKQKFAIIGEKQTLSEIDTSLFNADQTGRTLTNTHVLG